MSDWAERRSDALVREWQARQTPPDAGARWWLIRRIAAELRAVAPERALAGELAAALAGSQDALRGVALGYPSRSQAGKALAAIAPALARAAAAGIEVPR
jgi:hypothetical protein